MLEMELLEEVALAQERWAEVAHGVINLEWLLNDIVEEEAGELCAQYIHGSITIDELRGGTKWANALDKEAIQRYGVELSQGKQQEERTARRIMHLAGRRAYDSLRSKRHRDMMHAKSTSSLRGLGMGRLETHDIKDRSLVQ